MNPTPAPPLPSSQSTTPPNFLFLCPDQLRWDWIGGAGEVAVHTPNIDALAARGVRFTQCRTNSPLCAPARAALATGQRYARCGVPDNSVNLDTDRPNVFQALRRAGYRVATSGKNDLFKPDRFRGLGGWTASLGRAGFTEAINMCGKLDAARHHEQGPHCAYTAYLCQHGLMNTYAEDYHRRRDQCTHPTAPWPSPLPRHAHPNDFAGRASLELLDGLPRDNPWMLWVNFPGPHDPFDPPRELQQRYDDIAFPDPIEAQPTYADKPVDHQQVRRNYAAEIQGIDQWVGYLVDRVAQRGELDNTVVVFTSDHGEMLGDHGLFLKHVAYEGSVHVPLIVAGPGIEPVEAAAGSRTSEALVELIDISATLLDLADLPAPDGWEARSFAPILRGHADAGIHREVQVSGLGDWSMIFDGRFKLIERRADSDGEEDATLTLYDLETDPGERDEVIARHPDLAARLRERLHEQLTL